ncbi:hypothetical protein Taro_006581 [Colocasia esculenta]|uniref:SH2 domain-containing protein n=1 Tax=Colocasia esculenta TaxID=4460 RepID=A0A843U160_COLES|nr:hypothetical protein [Colocasia esculenta]
MAEEGGEHLDCEYSELKDLRISLDRRVVGGWGEGGGAGFCLCFWLYLKSPVDSSTVILRQMQSDSNKEIPFLILNKEKEMTLLPLLALHEEDTTGTSVFHDGMSSVSAKTECPKDKWIHVGCEVSREYIRLHIDGEAVGEKSKSSFSKNPDQDILEGISLVGNDDGNKKLQGYIHYVQIFPLSSDINVTDLSKKNLPIQLCLDCSCISDGIEEGVDGVWNVVGGKASCRRKFSLDLILLDPLGCIIHKEIEVLASLVYADDGTTVKKPYDDAEGTLLVNCDGLEFPSTERTLKLIDGRASIKLKISQLSSKCDNRLFRVRFHPSNDQKCPFLEAYSPPIRCISRSRNSRGNVTGKKQSHSPGANERSCEIQDMCSGMQMSNGSDSKCSSPSSKRPRLGCNDSPRRVDANDNSPQAIDGCISHDLAANGANVVRTDLDMKFEHHVETDNVLSDSESTDARNSVFTRINDSRKTISDTTVFKYCLGGTDERSLLLKEVVAFASDKDIMDFAEQVSLYAGCPHHRYQISIAKQLVKEGADSWKSLSHNEDRVLWSDVIPEIDRKFRKITHSSRRGLSGEDIEVLRRIAGCGDDLARENFDKMWHWLYPVALTLSKDCIHTLWESMSPRWIEGIITMEEAESSLKGPTGHLDPGTFILRFPTSRSWPHPDAGSLVVTYVGADHTLHNRLLSIDDGELNSRPLQDLLLQEPELYQLGRVRREVTQHWRTEA